MIINIFAAEHRGGGRPLPADGIARHKYLIRRLKKQEQEQRTYGYHSGYHRGTTGRPGTGDWTDSSRLKRLGFGLVRDAGLLVRTLS